MNNLTQWWIQREQPQAVAQTMWESWKAPHRIMVPLALKMLSSVESVYELGCGSGPNLRLLKEIQPGLSIGGSEPSPGLAGWASEHLGVHIDQLTLPEVPSDRWDVYLSCYALAYVDPEDVLTTLRALDGRALVLMEPQGEGELVQLQTEDGASYGLPEWHHDYLALLPESGWRMTWRWPVLPPVQGLNAVLIAER